MFTIMVHVCYLLSGQPVCQWQYAAQHLPMQACGWAQAGMAQWKENSKFKGDEYYIERYRCVADSEASIPGDL